MAKPTGAPSSSIPRRCSVWPTKRSRVWTTWTQLNRNPVHRLGESGVDITR